MQKPIVIKLTWKAGVAGAADHYVVTKIVNSTEYHAGATLSKKDVDALVARRNWRVETE